MRLKCLLQYKTSLIFVAQLKQTSNIKNVPRGTLKHLKIMNFPSSTKHAHQLLQTSSTIYAVYYYVFDNVLGFNVPMERKLPNMFFTRLFLQALVLDQNIAGIKIGGADISKKYTVTRATILEYLDSTAIQQ